MLITFHKRMTAKELDKAAKQCKVEVANWFATHPKRRVCNAQLWYGRVYKIKRTQIAEGIAAARKDANMPRDYAGRALVVPVS